MTTNWAGNVTFAATALERPNTLTALRDLVAGSDRVRVLGTGHSFNTIADTDGTLVSLDELPRVAEIDTEEGTIRLDGGIRYADVALALRGSGLALANTASLPHICVAGACATGTHGSGVTNQVLPAAVRELTLITATGDLVRLDREDPSWPGVPLSLGRLGVVAELLLDLVPGYDVAQTVLDLPDDTTPAADLPAILEAAYSVSVFTTWARPAAVQIWLKERVGRPGAWSGDSPDSPRWGGRPADAQRHMIDGMPAEYTTAQLAVPGPWDERMPHFRADFLPSSGEELQSEYLLPMRHAGEAWERLSRVHDRIAPVLQVCEVRAVAGDDLWLSPTAGETSVAYHFTWISDAERVAPAVATVEEALSDLGARPHWGKVFAMRPLPDEDPGLERFQRLVTELDPDGVFGNELVDRWLGLR